jgi:subtilisin family serine protease
LRRSHLAWSSPFTDEALKLVPPIPLLEGIRSEHGQWSEATGKGIKVAVIDSGIDATHPAVGSVAGYLAIDEGPDGLTYDTHPHTDAFGHATACAGIIRSIAPECELYSIKVLGSGLVGRGSVFAAGLRWAIEQGMNVCNLSLGTTKHDFFGLFHELADLAYFHNVVLVTAANNIPMPSFPSTYASVVSVAAHEGTDSQNVYYYNPEPPVEFGAPGIEVRVAWLNGGWIRGTGNSYAAPHITGLVAKILSKYPSMTPFQVKTVLWASAANVRDTLTTADSPPAASP